MYIYCNEAIENCHQIFRESRDCDLLRERERKTYIVHSMAVFRKHWVCAHGRDKTTLLPSMSITSWFSIVYYPNSVDDLCIKYYCFHRLGSIFNSWFYDIGLILNRGDKQVCRLLSIPIYTILYYIFHQI